MPPAHAKKSSSTGRNALQGFTYIGVLFGVALIGLVLGGGAQLASKQLERQRVAQADWALRQYRAALLSYHKAAPGAERKMPSTLEDLLLDRRYLGVVRHLRRLYEVPCEDGSLATLTYVPQASAAELRATCGLGAPNVLLVQAE